MAKSTKKVVDKKSVEPKKASMKKPSVKKLKTEVKKPSARTTGLAVPLSAEGGPAGAAILDRLFATIVSRKGVDPSVSHSARLLSRGRAKVAQKFGEEAVECLIEAVAGNRTALVAESADVLYHLLVMWMDAGVEPDEVWQELERRQGVSGIAEKAARAQKLLAAARVRSTKIP